MKKVTIHRFQEVTAKPKPADTMYHPEPAPGYHTPLPYGPTLPGYIPPQVVFSKYAKKNFNHRAIIAGSDTPVSDNGTDDVPNGFLAYPMYPMKSPRLASVGPMVPSGSPEQGPSYGTAGHSLQFETGYSSS